MTKAAVACLTLILAASAAAQDAPKAAPARSADVQSIDAIVGALYDVISGPAGQQRDWDRLRSLFVPGARMIPTALAATGGTAARVLDVDGYIQRSGPALERGFFEREVARKTELFDNIAHVFSTYESRRALADAAPFARGINSIQLMKDGDRWWVVTIFWQAERPDHPIPSTYLPAK
jgi:hypothetical protein